MVDSSKLGWYNFQAGTILKDLPYSPRWSWRLQGLMYHSHCIAKRPCISLQNVIHVITPLLIERSYDFQNLVLTSWHLDIILICKIAEKNTKKTQQAQQDRFALTFNMFTPHPKRAACPVLDTGWTASEPTIAE